jgi:hypothetical protein
MKYLGFMAAIFALMFISGCSSTIYVCYDNTTKTDQSKCPIVPVPAVTELDAGKAMDSYGFAVAQAKKDSYTRVNLYSQGGSWYASVLFTNSETASIQKLLFKIDGKTADVSCITGCDYLKIK